MIWLVWRQQRFEALLGLAVFAMAAATILFTGMAMISSFDHLGVAACVTNSSEACFQIRSAFQQQFSSLPQLAGWFNLLPWVLGVALGAPLATELESGTYRLAWTQSITHERWLRIRLYLVVAAAILLSLPLMLLMRWWNGPFAHFEPALDPNAFDFEGPVVIAYTVFAASLALAASSVLRRTIPTVAVTLVGFLIARLGIENVVRMHYLAPITKSPDPHLWTSQLGMILTSGWHGRRGQTIDIQAAFTACTPTDKAAKQAIFSCMRHHGYIDFITYQPANRFWIFQGIESAIFLGMAAALLGLTFWWVRRRMS